MRRFIGFVALVGALTGCTTSEVEAWLDWWTSDPEAAVEFTRLEWVRRDLRDEPDADQGGGDSAGVYEPWISLAECESGGDWDIATGNGYYGGLQFSLRSWEWVGGSGYPHHASPSEQVYRAERLLDLQGWGAWPTCSARLGLR
jgi:Transglycosylase-like domain